MKKNLPSLNNRVYEFLFILSKEQSPRKRRREEKDRECQASSDQHKGLPEKSREKRERQWPNRKTRSVQKLYGEEQKSHLKLSGQMWKTKFENESGFKQSFRKNPRVI